MKSATIVTYIYKDISEESLNFYLNIVVYCTMQFYDKIVSMRSKFKNSKTIIIISEINNLEVYHHHKSLIDERKLDSSIYIPFNKTSFIRNLAKTNPFKTSHFVWINDDDLKDIANIDIQKYLTKKVIQLDNFFIVPQNMAWHYRYLVDNEFHRCVFEGNIPNEKEIYKSIENRNKDIIGYEEETEVEEAAINTKIKAVIARYNEDVSWVRDLKCDYIIYNKNESEASLFEHNLPNVGREGHTFFTYIINNYDNLPEYVCFLHGIPYDHCLDVVNKINNFNMIDDFIPLSASYILGTWEWERTYALADRLGLSYDEPLKMISSCQSIISRDLILKTSKETYEKLLNALSYHINPQEAYIIENLWPTIFNFNNQLIPTCDNCRGYWGGC